MSAWPRVWCGGPAEPQGPPALVVELEVVTKGESNARGFWDATNRRKRQDAALETALTEPGPAAALAALVAGGGPWLVRFTRLAPARLDEDNLGGAFKRLQDALARALGVKDHDPRWCSCRRQVRRSGDPGVVIEVWGPSAMPPQ